MSTVQDSELFTQAEVAKRLKVCKRTVYLLTKAGKLKARYVTPTLPRYSESDIADYIASLGMEATADGN